MRFQIEIVSLLTIPALGAALKLKFHNLKASTLETSLIAPEAYLFMYMMPIQNLSKSRAKEKKPIINLPLASAIKSEWLVILISLVFFVRVPDWV